MGNVVGIDPEGTTGLTYTFIDDASGTFTINSTSGQITVANSSQLNFEGRSSMSVIAKVTDQGGLSYNETIAINLTNVNEAPTFSVGNGRNIHNYRWNGIR